MSQPIIVDTSALLAVLKEEPGAELVYPHLPYAVISSVNLIEAASYLVGQGLSLEETSHIIQDLSLDIAAHDMQQAFIAASLLPHTKSKGLSLGDRACLALALHRNLPVFTADKVWASLDIGVDIRLIR